MDSTSTVSNLEQNVCVVEVVAHKDINHLRIAEGVM